VDLIYIFRKYKNRKSLVILLFIIMVVMYGILLTAIILHIKNMDNIYESYEISKESILEEDITKTEQEENETEEQEESTTLPNLTSEGIENVKNIYKQDAHIAYITFDDGPSKTVTPKILEILEEKNIKATFFVLGSRVELNPELVKQEYEAGHYIANHGYSHIYSQIYVSTDTVLDEYNKTEQAIRNAIGIQEYSSHLFRFPGGSYGGKYADLKKEAEAVLEQNNITFVDWNALTGDAEGKKTKEDMLSFLEETVASKKNVVVLMHDAGDKTVTAEVLPEVIDFLSEKGYVFDNFYSLIK
jgi:peptidoglycan/xylan/chitin deacetylase (PgdA/CDA1 family)